MPSLNTGSLPQDWKTANITAIHKKGNKTTAGNYRPVSLTSIVCKVMETLVRESLMSHMMEHNMLSDKQFGFIKGRSTVLQLLQVMDQWTAALDAGDAVDVIFCDFMKAFDKVPHGRLLDTLKSYGFRDPLLSWIRGFLSNRTQTVIVNGSTSKPHPVLSGIPQGSVLGPSLFIIYINSLPDTVSSSIMYLFADDTKMFKTVKDDDDIAALQKDIDSMWEWTKSSP